jgi:hypothetical protein
MILADRVTRPPFAVETVNGEPDYYFMVDGVLHGPVTDKDSAAKQYQAALINGTIREINQGE